MTPGSELTDAEVIAASLEHPAEFGEVFRRHHGVVFGFVARGVGYQDARDVTAEVFEQALRSRRSYNPAYPSARGWLLGIAAHLVARHHRHRSTQRELLAKQQTLTEEVVADFSDTLATRLDANKKLGDAMGRLRKPEREVVALFVFGQLSYREIAETLGIAEGTVRSRLSRARGKLRNFLTDPEQSSSEDPEGTHE